MPAAGEVIGRAAANLSRAARRVFASRVLPSEDSCWVEVQLQAHLGDQRGPRNPFVSEHHLTFLEILQVIDAAGRDPRVDGVLLKFEGGPVSFAQALSLRRAVLRLPGWRPLAACHRHTRDHCGLLLAPGDAVPAADV